jgi:hypothetical protein
MAMVRRWLVAVTHQHRVHRRATRAQRAVQVRARTAVPLRKAADMLWQARHPPLMLHHPCQQAQRCPVVMRCCQQLAVQHCI